MPESTQHKLDRVRPPRVQITYDVEIGDAIVMKELARALHACGNLDAAADFFGRAIALAPDDPEAHCDFGRLQGETGNHRDAVRHFKRALELDPGRCR